jgi:hypothetical protein
VQYNSTSNQNEESHGENMQATDGISDPRLNTTGVGGYSSKKREANASQTPRADTIFFKHKYITQPTVTSADAIVKAYQDLTFALQGIKNHKGNAHMEALARVQDALTPRYEHTVDQPVQPDPRVQEKIKQQQQQQHETPIPLRRQIQG